MPELMTGHRNRVARALIKPGDGVRRVNVADQRHGAVCFLIRVKVRADDGRDAPVKIRHGADKHIADLGEIRHARHGPQDGTGTAPAPSAHGIR